MCSIVGQLTHNPRATFWKYDPEAHALYYVEGVAIRQVMCADKKPKHRQSRLAMIGRLNGRVYSTARKHNDHTLHKKGGWGVSKFLLDHSAEFGFDSVEFDTPRGKAALPVSFILIEGQLGGIEVFHEVAAGYEPQYLLTPKVLGLPEVDLPKEQQ